jgi:hypothetical protein
MTGNADCRVVIRMERRNSGWLYTGCMELFFIFIAKENDLNL